MNKKLVNRFVVARLPEGNTSGNIVLVNGNLMLKSGDRHLILPKGTVVVIDGKEEII